MVLRLFLERPPPPQKNTWHFWRKSGYLPAGCLRHKRALVIIIICYILWKKSGTMLISQCESRVGKEKVIANEEKGRRGIERDAHFKTPSLMRRVSPRFQPNNSQKKTRGFWPDPPSFLNGPRGLCTVPKQIFCRGWCFETVTLSKEIEDIVEILAQKVCALLFEILHLFRWVTAVIYYNGQANELYWSSTMPGIS